MRGGKFILKLLKTLSLELLFLRCSEPLVALPPDRRHSKCNIVHVTVQIQLHLTCYLSCVSVAMSKKQTDPRIDVQLNLTYA